MPAVSDKQQRLVYAKRSQYGSKEKAPKEWKWVFSSDWDAKKKESTKRYVSFFESEDNSLSELTDDTIPEKIVDFIIKNPFPKDHTQIHSFAEGLGLEPDKLEQYIYAFLTVILTGGKSKGVFASKDIEQMAWGEKIESEHVELSVDNKVVKAIQLLLKHKISNDHLQENSKYYSAELFQKEMEKEGK